MRGDRALSALIHFSNSHGARDVKNLGAAQRVEGTARYGVEETNALLPLDPPTPGTPARWVATAADKPPLTTCSDVRAARRRAANGSTRGRSGTAPRIESCRTWNDLYRDRRGMSCCSAEPAAEEWLLLLLRDPWLLCRGPPAPEKDPPGWMSRSSDMDPMPTLEEREDAVERRSTIPNIDAKEFFDCIRKNAATASSCPPPAAELLLASPVLGFRVMPSIVELGSGGPGATFAGGAVAKTSIGASTAVPEAGLAMDGGGVDGRLVSARVMASRDEQEESVDSGDGLLPRERGDEDVIRPEDAPGTRPLEGTVVCWSKPSLPTSTG